MDRRCAFFWGGGVFFFYFPYFLLPSAFFKTFCERSNPIWGILMTFWSIPGIGEKSSFFVKQKWSNKHFHSRRKKYNWSPFWRGGGQGSRKLYPCPWDKTYLVGHKEILTHGRLDTSHSRLEKLTSYWTNCPADWTNCLEPRRGRPVDNRPSTD